MAFPVTIGASGLPIVVSENGYGLPVRVVERGGFPVTVAENGFGLPVVVVSGTIDPPPVTAPTTVTLSSTSRTIPNDTALTLELAALSANGTQPVTWTTDSAYTYISAGRLYLDEMPPNGVTAIKVRATNSAGFAEATFTLTVEAAQTGGIVETNQGTVSDETTEGDGSLTFTLTGGDHPGSYTIPAAVIAGGYPHVLVPPTITTADDAGQPRFTVEDDGLYVWPVDDPAEIAVDWTVSDTFIAAGPSYTRLAEQANQEVAAVVKLTNLASVTDDVAVTTKVVAQAAVAFTYTPSIFKRTLASRIEWATAGGLGTISRALFFTRNVITPDQADQRGATLGLYYGGGGSMVGNFVQGTTTVTFRSYLHNTGGDYSDIPFASGDVIDTIAAFAWSEDFKNHTIWQRVNYGAPLVRPITFATPITINAAAVTAIAMGGKAFSSGPAGGVDQSIHRAALWLGTSLDPQTNLDKFFKGNGDLEHPSLLADVLGTPDIDWYNGSNHGSRGAPSSIVGVA